MDKEKQIEADLCHLLENRKQIQGKNKGNGGRSQEDKVKGGNDEKVTEEERESDTNGNYLKSLKGEMKNFYQMIPAKLNWTKKIMENKIIFLEETLNNKKEIILEREIAIEELEKEIKQIQEKVNENKEQNLENAMKLNEVKMDFRDIMRKIMAVVSEVSVYQTNVVNLERIKQEKKGQLKSIEGQMKNIYQVRVDESIHQMPSVASGRVNKMSCQGFQMRRPQV